MNALPQDVVLRARDVHVVRDGRPILREVSLTVRTGEHWALLGANGAGKSTLLGLLGARTHPSRGSVDVLGRRLGRVDVREVRTDVGHVDPRHPLTEPLRLRDVVLTGVTNSVALLPRWRPTVQQERRADDLIGTLGLAALRGARWPTLSQGQRGRTLIARALMPEPRLLLLDEPATGLDLPGREQLIEALASLRTAHPGWRRCWSPTTWRSCRRTPRTPCCCGTGGRWPRGRWPGRSPGTGSARASTCRWSWSGTGAAGACGSPGVREGRQAGAFRACAGGPRAPRHLFR